MPDTIQHLYFTKQQRETISNIVDRYRERRMNSEALLQSLQNFGFNCEAAKAYRALVESTEVY